MSEFAARFAGIVGSDSVLMNEPMRAHTTFRIGGPADYFLTPHSEEEIAELIRFCRSSGIPHFLMGNGSNLLVSDSGFRGAVIRLGRDFAEVKAEGNEITAKAGALLSSIAAVALEHALTGFEFASGIPGTLGGACMMNAGAYGGEMKDVLIEATALDVSGEIRTLKKEEMGLGYRTSAFMQNGMLVLSAKMRFATGDPDAIRAYQAELREKRQTKQPLELPSAGSTFRRPEGYFAGKLIMDAGLRGFRVGGACVSEKHCGFVVNTGDATAADVYTLIGQVKDKVYEAFGVTLEPEVRFLGEF